MDNDILTQNTYEYFDRQFGRRHTVKIPSNLYKYIVKVCPSHQHSNKSYVVCYMHNFHKPIRIRMSDKNVIKLQSRIRILNE